MPPSLQRSMWQRSEHLGELAVISDMAGKWEFIDEGKYVKAQRAIIDSRMESTAAGAAGKLYT